MTLPLFGPPAPRRIELPDGDVTYISGFMEPAECRVYFEQLQGAIAWRHEEVSLYGRRIPLPRLTAWHGDPEASYTYSRIQNKPCPWTSPLLAIKQRVEARTGATFNGVLLNLYRDGEDSIAWHSDDEREFGERPTIASLSLGAHRVFWMRHKHDKEVPKVSQELEDGSLLVMQGDTQRFWEHEIRKSKAVRGARINLTFRLVKPAVVSNPHR
ncbi:MAG: alpha-ketoglutarate-dependent dioxygenase AlkB [Candidatus Sericytochromatia bacterium]|nr:alpha-ketoglutarate-dependent dioxygenase AlkB [Candidatus Sericytochromatia bacterium]